MNETKKGEKGSETLLNDVRNVKLRKSVISKRLEAGRTIQLNFKTKAQLLTIIFKNDPDEKRTHLLITGKNPMLQIVLIADPFAPHVLMYVSTAESPLAIYEDFEE